MSEIVENIADHLKQIGFKVTQEENKITVKSKWFCSVIADFSATEIIFGYKFGKIDRRKSIIGSLILFSIIITVSLDSPFLPIYIFLFSASLIHDWIRYLKTQKIQELIKNLVPRGK